MRRLGVMTLRSSPSLCRDFLATAILVLLFPSASSAQRIEGHVREATGGRPVGRGFVVLLDSGGAEIQRTLVDGAGRFRFDTRPGTFLVRSERIGYRPAISDMIVLERTDTASIALDVDPIPYALDEIEVNERKVCGLAADASEDMLAVWREAEKALRAAVWTAGQRAYRYTVNIRDRLVREDGESVREEHDSTAEALATIPFRAPRPAILAGGGYVVPHQDGTSSYYAPDANVLLHDTFLETHCFSVIRDGGWIGLAFEPKPDRDLPDVRGTVWIDLATAQLDEVEYRYTGLDRDVTDRSVGGSIEFMPVPSGDWIVHRWHIRMPQLGWVAGDRRARTRIRGYQDAIGEVLAIHDREGATVYTVPPAVLEGTIFDSVLGQPLAEAFVQIAGSNRATTTASSGRFTLSAPLRGRYSVTVSHPSLDSLGATIDAHEVTLEPGETHTVALATPSAGTVWHRLCPGDRYPPADSHATGNTWAVFGRVNSDQGAAPGVTVSATWRAVPRTRGALILQDWNTNSTTDDGGRFVICGLPIETPIRLTAYDSMRTSGTEVIEFDRDDTQVTVMDEGTFAWALPFWRRDMRVTRSSSATASLSGRFVDTDGRGLSGVAVTVSGQDALAVSSDSMGLFALNGIPAGQQLITMRRVGYRPIAYSVVLSPGEQYALPRDVSTLVAGTDIELDPIVVTGERAMTRVMREFEERRKLGFGDHLIRDEWEDNPPAEASDLLRRMAGIRVSVNPNYGRTTVWNGQSILDTRRVLIINRRAAEQGECPMLVFLDNMLMGTTFDINVDNLINVRATQAVEVYTGSGQTPATFNVTGARCGVVAFWTR